tara:strand:- start:1327 stop:1860 length:534 start_codon:yes stop_codon:yes gene_type:complete
MEDSGESFDFSGSVGKTLKRARTQKGLSRAKVAEFIGISPNSLVKYELAGEDGGQFPPLPKLVRLCELLEIDPRLIFDIIRDNDDFKGKRDKFDFNYYFRDLNNEWTMEHLYGQIGVINVDIGGIYESISALSEKIDKLSLPTKENGPDHKGPSRRSKNPSAAVDAALTPPKEEDQT